MLPQLLPGFKGNKHFFRALKPSPFLPTYEDFQIWLQIVVKVTKDTSAYCNAVLMVNHMLLEANFNTVVLASCDYFLIFLNFIYKFYLIRIS